VWVISPENVSAMTSEKFMTKIIARVLNGHFTLKYQNKKKILMLLYSGTRKEIVLWRARK